MKPNNRARPRPRPLSGTRAVRCLAACALAGLLSVAGCRGSRLVPLTPDEIATYGTAAFEAPRERVFRACVAALEANGYTIARDDAAAGLIVTERMQAHSARVADDEQLFLRRYEITVRPAAGGALEVVATPLGSVARRSPHATSSPRDTGPETAWTPEDERAEWRRLFDAVRRHLVEQASSARARGRRPRRPVIPTSRARNAHIRAGWRQKTHVGAGPRRGAAHRPRGGSSLARRASALAKRGSSLAPRG